MPCSATHASAEAETTPGAAPHRPLTIPRPAPTSVPTMYMFLYLPDIIRYNARNITQTPDAPYHARTNGVHADLLCYSFTPPYRLSKIKFRSAGRVNSHQRSWSGADILDAKMVICQDSRGGCSSTDRDAGHGATGGTAAQGAD